MPSVGHESAPAARSLSDHNRLAWAPSWPAYLEAARFQYGWLEGEESGSNVKEQIRNVRSTAI